MRVILSCLVWLLATVCFAGPARINQEGRILGALPGVSNPMLFDTTNADAVLSAMQILPVTNPWNECISNRPVLVNSDAMIAQIIANASSAGRYFRTSQEMNYVLVPDSQVLVSNLFTDWPDQSDLNGGVSPYGRYPTPTNLPIESWSTNLGISLYDWQTNNDGSDRSSIIVQPGKGYIFEAFHTLLAGTNWQASGGAIFNLNSNGLRPEGWVSANAAGLPIFPGVVRFDECERGMVEHACGLVVPKSRAEHIYPATHDTGGAAMPATETNYPAMGQRFRLKASFVIPDNWSKEEKALALGLKKYGALVEDTSGSMFAVSVTPDERWPAGTFDDFLADHISITNFEAIQTTGPNEGPRSPGAPTVSAGAAPTASVGRAVTLQGKVTYTNPVPAVQWQKYSGPGLVLFGNPARTNTTALFSAPGAYTLEISANDGVHAVAYDAVTFNVTGTTIRPTLTITNPAKSGAAWSNAQFTAGGKCGSTFGISNVWLSLNTNGWVSATSLNSSNWSEQVMLVPGTNSLAVYAQDNAGIFSLTNSTKLVYVLTAPLTVSTNGRGSFTPSVNGSLLQIGKGYALTAKPATGFGFVNWTDGLGNPLTNGLTLKFVMASNLDFAANFRDITKPTLTITNPAKSGVLVSNAVFIVAGTCGDNVQVSNVWISFNGTNWAMFNLPNTNSHWNEQVALVPGTNTFLAFAEDGSGNVSPTNKTTVVYVPDTRTIIGAWNLIQFQTPAQIYFDAGNALQGGGNFAVGNGNLTLDTNGGIAGTLGDAFTGVYAADTNGIISALITNSSGADALNFFVNASKDNLMQYESYFDSGDNHQSMAIGHRIPPAIANGDLAGYWNVIQYQTPVQITGDLNGVQGGNNFGVTNGNLTLTANGTFSGKLMGSVSGTFNASSNGVINVVPNSSGAQPLTFYLNYTKDTMTTVSSQLDANNNQQQLNVCLKAPAAIALADLVGAWNMVQFTTPLEYVPGSATFPDGGSNFGVTNGTMTVSANGTVSGVLQDAFNGTISPGSKGVVVLKINVGGSVQQKTFYINAAKDAMIEVEQLLDSADNQQQLVLAHRVPKN